VKTILVVIGLIGLGYIAFWACVIFVYVVVWIVETIAKLLK